MTLRRILAYMVVFLVMHMIASEGYAVIVGEVMPYWSRIVMAAVIAGLVAIGFDRWWPRQPSAPRNDS